MKMEIMEYSNPRALFFIFLAQKSGEYYYFSKKVNIMKLQYQQYKYINE